MKWGIPLTMFKWYRSDQAQNSARIHAILPSLVEDFLRHIIIGVHFMWHIA